MTAIKRIIILFLITYSAFALSDTNGVAAALHPNTVKFRKILKFVKILSKFDPTEELTEKEQIDRVKDPITAFAREFRSNSHSPDLIQSTPEYLAFSMR